MFRHRALLDSGGLDSGLILKIQLGEEEETRMGVDDELVTGYRAKHPRLFPDREDLTAIKAKVQDTRVGKKRHR